MGAADVMDVGPEPEQAHIDRFVGEYAWLSNFHRADVKLDGVLFPTVEHAYQAAKTKDKREREAIRALPTATAAKKMGRTVKIRKDWEDVKLEVMADLLKQKFSIPRLRDLLMATGDCHIEEGNWWGDEYWGINFKTGAGDNWLGVLIMQVRDELQ